MANIFLSYAIRDRERARELVAVLEARGWTVCWNHNEPSASQNFTDVISDQIKSEIEKADCVLVLWSKDSISSRWIREEANEGLEHRKLIPVLVDPVVPPAEFRAIQTENLSAWTGDRHDPSLERLIADISHVVPPRPHVARSPEPSAPPPAASIPSRPSPAARFGINRIWDKLWRRDREKPAQKSVPPAHPAPPVPEPVLLGVSAPRRVELGGMFSARFVAYIQVLEERVRQQLNELDGDEAQSALGIAPDRAARWEIGAPVAVRLEAGPHISVRPPEASFEWSGRHNLVSFSLTVAPDAPAVRTQLRFEAFIEGLPVAFIPLDIAIGQRTDSSRVTRSTRPHATAFASYSSLDAQAVTLCLSALSRWDAGLKIFMDCLDLKPNEPWRNELERVIPEQDAFFLFWSANAMKSKWVDWEWRHALAKKGIDVVRPFPLDDPAVAPPPQELQHLHFRDRYMMAREALARVAERRT